MIIPNKIISNKLLINKLSFLSSFMILLSSLICINSNTILAQSNSNVADIKCPEYNFTRTLLQGDRGVDVKLMQKILNLDYRTRIAQAGPGSKGSETELYGVATREAVKRFQALFIEIIGLADGKINSRTLTVLNSVCKGPYFTGGGGEVFDLKRPTTTVSTTKDTINPGVTISAPSSVYTGESYRLWIYASEPIQSPALGNFIVSNDATLSDIRKENPSTYKVTVTPTRTATHTIAIQLEADTIRDVSGNKNINASNEINTLITPAPVGPDTTNPSVSLLNTSSLSVGTYGTNKSISLTVAFSEPILVSATLTLSNFITTGPITLSNLKKVDERLYSLTITATGLDKSVASIRLPAGLVSDLSGNKNNASPELTLVINKPENPNPTPDPEPTSVDYSGDGGGGLGELLQMLGPIITQGLTSLLGSGLGGGTEVPNKANSGSAGGYVSAPSNCACAPSKNTILMTAYGIGVTGYYFKNLNPTVQPGCYVSGTPVMVPASLGNICGQASKFPSTFGGCRGWSVGGIQGCCLNPQNNMAGQLVVGSFPPPPLLRGCGQ